MAPDRIRVVDAETASLAVALLAQAIERRLARGTTDVELEHLIARFKATNGVVFTVGTLEYLRRGGRIGGAQALMGSLLSVKPILSVADGVIHPIGRVRGRKKALAEFARVFREATDDAPGLRVAIAHADAPEWIDDIKAIVAAERPHADPEVLVAELGAVVGTHAGPRLRRLLLVRRPGRLVVVPVVVSGRVRRGAVGRVRRADRVRRVGVGDRDGRDGKPGEDRGESTDRIALGRPADRREEDERDRRAGSRQCGERQGERGCADDPHDPKARRSICESDAPE